MITELLKHKNVRVYSIRIVSIEVIQFAKGAAYVLALSLNTAGESKWILANTSTISTYLNRHIQTDGKPLVRCSSVSSLRTLNVIAKLMVDLQIRAMFFFFFVLKTHAAASFSQTMTTVSCSGWQWAVGTIKSGSGNPCHLQKNLEWERFWGHVKMARGTLAKPASNMNNPSSFILHHQSRLDGLK